MTDAELTCRQLLAIVSKYLDDELAPDLRMLFETHLDECPDCVDYLDGYRRTILLARDTTDAGSEVPEDVPPPLIAAVLAVIARG